MSEIPFELRKEIITFHNSLELLRDFIGLIDAYLNEKVSKILSAHTEEISVIVLAGLKTGVIPKTFVKTGDDEEIDENLIDKMQEKLESNFNTKLSFETVEKDGKQLVSWKFEDNEKNNISEAIERISKAQKRNSLLYNSALMSLTSSVELLFSKIFHKYYDCFPNAIDDKDKTFTYEEIKKYDTLIELRRLHISTKIETLLRNSFLDWIKELRDKRKVPMSFLDSTEEDILVETFMRRNLIVHNGGIVNNIYLSNVSPSLAKDVSLGAELELNLHYLEERIDALERNCILIAAACWKHFAKNDVNLAKTLDEITYNHLNTKRWSISESLSYFNKENKETPNIHQTIGKLNYWLSKKRQGKWDDISKEVEAADFSDKGLRLQLGLIALEEKYDEFFSIVPKAIQINEICLHELNEFPIFEEMRQDSRFEEYFETEAKEK
jgi:hypothetical protein